MAQPCSYAWRGSSGCGKKTELLNYIRKQGKNIGIDLEIKTSVWFLNKQTNNANPDEEDDEISGKSIPYEESQLHLGFDVARMSMSDKVFLQSILTRWTGQQDVCLISSMIQTRYLVLYHAHFLTDESVLQLQECLEQYPTFTILLTTELPLCGRLRDFCFEIPVNGKDNLLDKYTKSLNITEKDVWLEFFKETLEDWSKKEGSAILITEIRNWIYICLQRNLRWTDVIMYWIIAIYETEWMTPKMKSDVLDILWKAESSSGWVLVTSYRIPILWEHVHLQLARCFYKLRSNSL
jgi:hypothetical protein